VERRIRLGSKDLAKGTGKQDSQFQRFTILKQNLNKARGGKKVGSGTRPAEGVNSLGDKGRLAEGTLVDLGNY